MAVIGLMKVAMPNVNICYMKIWAAERQPRSTILENLPHCFDRNWRQIIFQSALEPSLFTLFEFGFTIAQVKLTYLIHSKYAYQNTK